MLDYELLRPIARQATLACITAVNNYSGVGLTTRGKKRLVDCGGGFRPWLRNSVPVLHSRRFPFCTGCQKIVKFATTMAGTAIWQQNAIAEVDSE